MILLLFLLYTYVIFEARQKIMGMPFCCLLYTVHNYVDNYHHAINYNIHCRLGTRYSVGGKYQIRINKNNSLINGCHINNFNFNRF